MKLAPAKNRWEEIVDLWKSYPPMFAIAGFLAGLLLFPLLESISVDFVNLLSSLIPEAFGILFTVVILDRLAEKRQTQELQKRLQREAAGQSNETAKTAIDWMRSEGWLTGINSLLINANLSNANLEGVNLVNANLTGAILTKANLKAARMQGAILTNANLWHSNISEADLSGADLTGADIRGTATTSTNFHYTKLPDETKWTKSTDISQFTDTSHSMFRTAKSGQIIKSKQGVKMEKRPQKTILLVCTGNSCRSQIAAGIVKDKRSEQWMVVSGGVNPETNPDPRALAVLKEIGIDTVGTKPTHIQEYKARKLDLIVSFSDAASQVIEELFPNTPKIHLPIEDPYEAVTSPNEQLIPYRRTRDELVDSLLQVIDNY
jgi:arsenate reductase